MTILKKLRLRKGSGRMGHPNHAAVYLTAPQAARSTLHISHEEISRHTRI